MERQEWLEARRKGLGGSDAAAICGLSRWKSPMDVYLDKIGAGAEVEQNEPMYWGIKVEGLLRERFAEEHPELFVGDGLFLVHKEHPFMVGSFDGTIYDGVSYKNIVAGWEGKTASAYKRDEWSGDEVPIEYAIQCQWYMAVSGLPRWYLSVLIGGNDYREFVIERDEDIIAMLIERAKAFWTLVEERTPPPIDGTPASTDVLNRLYPADEAVLDPPLSMDDDAEKDVLAYLAARAALKAAQSVVDTFENKLKAQIGSYALGVTPDGYEVEWKPRTRKSYDTKRLVEKHPDIASQLERLTEYRVFTVKEPKERDEA